MTDSAKIKDLKEQIVTLEMRVKHLTNDLRLTREEYQFATRDNFQIYSSLEENAKELEKKTIALDKANKALQAEIAERKLTEEENKKLQANLAHAQKMEAIGTLAGGIAHDFNNLLSVIQGNASLMMYDMAPSDPSYENLKDIEKQIESGSNLTRQILGYARKGKYEVEPVQLNQLVEESSRAFGRTKKEITVHKDLAHNLVAIEADRGQVEQILLNLYVNAAWAMDDVGDIFLTTSNVSHEAMKGASYDPKPGNYVLLTVSDHGAGMDQQTMDRIFEPFFTTKQMGRGSGLGLASAYGIVKGHGGYIEVNSDKGHGTTFKVYLPATDKKVAHAGDAPGQTITGSESILLVDDEAMVLKTGMKVLERLGYETLGAGSGIEAVEIYKAKGATIDLVILDMVMPDMGGGETYERISEIDPDAKVLLSSGYSLEGQAAQVLKKGCLGFIQKPFTMKELSEQVRDVLERE